MGKSYRIAVIPGDGTGPEVVAEARKALDAAAGVCDVKLDYTEFNWGGTITSPRAWFCRMMRRIS